MKFASDRIEGGIVGCPGNDEIVRRRHQGDCRDLIMIFNQRHQRRLCPPLLARPKPVEEPEDQAMLSLALQEKRLNAFKELARIRKEFYLIGQGSH